MSEPGGGKYLLLAPNILERTMQFQVIDRCQGECCLNSWRI